VGFKDKYRVFFAFGIVLLGLVLPVYGQSDSMDLAAKYYQQKSYDSALPLFEEADRADPQNVAILYNLGNTLYKLDRYGEAIAFYRKAMQISPRDREIRDNLKTARARVLDRITERNSFGVRALSFFSLFTINEYLWTLFSLVFLLTVLAGFYMSGKKGEITRNSLVILVVLIFGLAFPAAFQGYRIINGHYGVVKDQKIMVKSGPSSSFSTLFFIHEGAELSCLKKLNKWTQIRLGNGFIGWIGNSSYVEI
jgi:tetratricopeptide (TPR) repeat protein